MDMKNVSKSEAGMISLSPEVQSTGFPFLVLRVYLCSLCCGNFHKVQLSLPRIPACAITHLKLHLFFFFFISSFILSRHQATLPPSLLLTSNTSACIFATPSPILYLTLFRQHHLATEAGCCGNISQRSWLPSLLP